MTAKKRKIDDDNEKNICCICGEKDADEMSDISCVFFRENNFYRPLGDIIQFTLGFKIQKSKRDRADVCQKCKSKILEFYKFKKASRELQKLPDVDELAKLPSPTALPEMSKLAKDATLIVNNYIKKYKIKSIIIKETSKKLEILSNETSANPEPSPQTQQSFSQPEKPSSPPRVDQNNDFSVINIKQEPEIDIIDEQPNPAEPENWTTEYNSYDIPTHKSRSNVQKDLISIMNRRLIQMDKKLDVIKQGFKNVQTTVSYLVNPMKGATEPQNFPDKIQCSNYDEVKTLELLLEDDHNKTLLEAYFLKNNNQVNGSDYKAFLRQGLDLVMTRELLKQFSYQGQFSFHCLRDLQCTVMLLQIANKILNASHDEMERYLTKYLANLRCRKKASRASEGFEQILEENEQHQCTSNHS